MHPRLQTLGLANNKLANLSDLAPLAALPTLLRLDLLGNPVTKKGDYRVHVISLLPKLKLLDGQRVREAERKEATRRAAKRDAAGGEAGDGSNTFEPGEGLPEAEAAAAAPPPKAGPTAEQLTRIRAAIQNADTMEEVQRLEKLLASGNVGGVLGDADMADA